MYMVMYVLDDRDLLDEVLDAWHALGVSGATVVDSFGLHRRRAQRRKIHLRFPFEGSSGLAIENHYTLFTIVENEELMHGCIDAIEQVVGDLSEPNTGVLAAWPLAVVKGFPKNPRKEGS